MYKDLFIFELLLGIGYFGSVYQVLHREEQKNYAFKIIKWKKGGSPSLKASKKAFEDLKSLEHPNVVKVFATFLDKRRRKLGVQMEFCVASLDILISRREGKRFSSTRMQEWMLQLISALVYIHGKNIVHGGLNPRNILYDEDLRLKIGDFDFPYNTLQKFPGPKGATVSCAAPEALDGSTCRQSDIYSLGCVFVCLATEKPRTKDGQFVPLPPTITYGEKKTDIIRQCLADEKDERPTAEEIKNTVETDDYKGLCLYNLPNDGSELSLNGRAVTKTANEGLRVFSNRKLNIDEKFCIQILNVSGEVKTQIVLGFIECHPLSCIKGLPEDLQGQKDILKCQLVVKKDQMLTTWFTGNKEIVYKYGNLSQVFARKSSAPRMWAVLLFGPEVRKVQITDYE